MVPGIKEGILIIVLITFFNYIPISNCFLGAVRKGNDTESKLENYFKQVYREEMGFVRSLNCTMYIPAKHLVGVRFS